MNDDEVLLAWLNTRGFRVDHDGGTLRRPTSVRSVRPQIGGVPVQAKHLDLYLSNYAAAQTVCTALSLRDANDKHAVHSLRDAVRTWMLGLSL